MFSEIIRLHCVLIQGKSRRDAVNHIMNITSEKKLTHCTQQLAVYILDIFMDNHYIATEQLLLLANTCLLIAGRLLIKIFAINKFIFSAKIEENSKTTPKIAELDAFLNSNYSLDDYKSLEVIILNFFNWYVMFPTPAHYTHYYMQEVLNYDDIRLKKTTLREILLELLSFTRKYLNAITEGNQILVKKN